MRFSSYNIFTAPLSNGEHILLNGLTGLMDTIDEEAYEVVSSYAQEDFLPSEIMDKIEVIRDHFLERGYLTELTPEEEVAKAESIAFELSSKRDPDQWSVVLVPNLGCNYRCTYCFEKEGGYPSKVMTKEEVDAVFKIIKDKIAPGENITLYGGEPLAKENRELIEYILKKCEEIDNTCFAVTNAHDLEHYMDLLGRKKISSVQITVDGPREIHNSRRIALDRESSYDKIMKNIETALKETDVSVKMRINVDKRNAPHIIDLLEDLDKRSILHSPSFLFVLNAVVGVGELTLVNTELMKLEASIKMQYPELDCEFTGRSMDITDRLFPAFYLNQKIPFRVSVCGADSGIRVFAPNGEIYPCWSALGKPDDVIGTYDETGTIRWNSEAKEKWTRKMVGYKTKCIRCRFAFICGGGCIRPALPNEESANIYDCDYYNNQFEDQLVKYTDSFLAAGNDSCQNTINKESVGNEIRADYQQKSRGDKNEK
ncbi:MAG: radical SAM protein [Clostridiales bacterium]|nr:radical SAM protein [Clostridiales bacterium]